MKNHWNSTIKRKVDTGGFLSESRDSKPSMYLLLELEDKDGRQSAPSSEGPVSGGEQSLGGLGHCAWGAWVAWLVFTYIRCYPINTCSSLFTRSLCCSLILQEGLCGHMSFMRAFPCDTCVHAWHSPPHR